MLRDLKDRAIQFRDGLPHNVLLGVAALLVFGSGLATGMMLAERDQAQRGNEPYLQQQNGRTTHQRGIDPRATIVPIDTYQDKKTRLW